MTSGSAREAALRILALRAHTAAELERKLVRRGFSREEARAAVRALAEVGLVDEEATASAIVRSELARGHGRRRAAAVLAARGSPEESARAALQQAGPEAEAAALRSALLKKARTLPPCLTPTERSRKLFAHLVRRGFAASAVLQALRAEGESTDEENG